MPEAPMKSVAIFCGASAGTDPIFREQAAALGQLCAQRNIRIVFGGGHVGLMGVLADAAMRSGGTVTGVIPRDLQTRELAHEGVSEMHVVDGMHERKALMGALADAFVALPGGLGTLEEFFEVLTWAQLRFHHKPCGLLNVAGYFDHLLGFVDHAVAQGFIDAKHRTLIHVASDPGELLDRLQAHLPRP